jgi:hypothetical protein
MEPRRQGPCGCPACRAGRECCAWIDEVEVGLSIEDPARRLMARALGILASAVPCQALAWCPVEQRGRPTAGSLVKLDSPVPVSAERARREYVLRYQEDDPFAPSRMLDSPRSLLTMDDIGGREGLLSTEYGREFLPEYRVLWETTMYLRDCGQMIGFVRLSRTAADGEFKPDELEFLRRSHDHLEHSYTAASANAG